MRYALESFEYLLQEEPGPGQYDPQQSEKPAPSKRPPFGVSAERIDRHARKFFLGSTVGIHIVIFPIDSW